MTTWTALESNPEKGANKVPGVSPLWSLTDVFGLEPDQLEWIPGPVKALILLYPCVDNTEQQAKDREAELQANPPTVPKDLFFLRQYIRNACGAIALVHGIANNPDIEIEDGSVLKKYLDASRDLSPEERGKMLESDTSFTEVHHDVAAEGQTDANLEDPNLHHYVVFVNHKNSLYELDGRKSYPTNHGETTEATFLQDAAKVCKGYISSDPDDVRFSVVALAPTLD